MWTIRNCDCSAPTDEFITRNYDEPEFKREVLGKLNSGDYGRNWKIRSGNSPHFDDSTKFNGTYIHLKLNFPHGFFYFTVYKE